MHVVTREVQKSATFDTSMEHLILLIILVEASVVVALTAPGLDLDNGILFATSIELWGLTFTDVILATVGNNYVENTFCFFHRQRCRKLVICNSSPHHTRF